ncbi:HPP family protein [Isorropodon fossajaponicum symbiont]
MLHALVSRPWNLIGGHSVSAAVGVACFYLIADINCHPTKLSHY